MQISIRVSAVLSPDGSFSFSRPFGMLFWDEHKVLAWSCRLAVVRIEM